MTRFIDEYGVAIVAALVIFALIGIVTLVKSPVSDAIMDLISNFISQAGI